MGQKKQNTAITYHIVRAQNENGLHICPNCGAEQTLEKLLDGCDYCNTRFDISAYRDKVMSYTKYKGNYENRQMTSSGMTWGILAGIGLVLTICLPIFAPLTLTFGVVAYIIMLRKNKHALQNTPLQHELAENNPDFSEETFMASMECKLKAIHYAESPEELGAFVKCDIAPLLQYYQNIISCDIGRMAIKRYYVAGDYQYVDVHRETEVYMDAGNQLNYAKSVVAMTLAKRRSYKLKNDIIIYRCSSCGSSISLVEGGKCRYCGNEMDYAAYDWMITDYKHVKEL